MNQKNKIGFLHVHFALCISFEIILKLGPFPRRSIEVLNKNLLKHHGINS